MGFIYDIKSKDVRTCSENLLTDILTKAQVCILAWFFLTV